MLEKCTPGDWNYVGDHVVGVVGDCECQTKPPEGDFVAYPLTAHESHDVVKPIFEDQLPEGVTMEEHMANCHLIAAAKDLFKACNAALPYLRDHIAMTVSEGPGDRIALDMCEAAIAKANGEKI